MRSGVAEILTAFCTMLAAPRAYMEHVVVSQMQEGRCQYMGNCLCYLITLWVVPKALPSFLLLSASWPRTLLREPQSASDL